MYDDLFLSMLIFAHCSSSLMLSSHGFYADRTSETVALDTANNVAIFVTDAPAKRAPTACPLSKSGKSLSTTGLNKAYHCLKLLFCALFIVGISKPHVSETTLLQSRQQDMK
jgi:hypothetical protein